MERFTFHFKKLFTKLISSLLFSLALLTFCFLALLNGCTATKPSNDLDENKITVVTTLFPYYDFIRQIAGDRINLVMMLPAGMDTHSFEPTPADLVTLQNADLFIYNGGELEGWVDNVLDSIDTRNLTVFNMIDYLKSNPTTSELLLTVEEQEYHSEHDHDDEIGKTNEIDEHIWTSPIIAQTIVSTICDVLILEDKTYETDFKQNAQNYITKLETLDDQIRQVVADSPLSIMVFGDKFPFLYFTKTYGLTYYAAFSSCSSETEPSVATLTFLIDTIKEKHLPVVYYMELSSSKIADTICSETKTKTLLFHSCHNVTAKDFESGVTYLSLMEHNLENLKTGLLYKGE